MCPVRRPHVAAAAKSLLCAATIMSARPGRIVRADRVNIPRPRNVFQIHEDPEFRRLYNEIWDELRVQVRNVDVAAH